MEIIDTWYLAYDLAALYLSATLWGFGPCSRLGGRFWGWVFGSAVGSCSAGTVLKKLGKCTPSFTDPYTIGALRVSFENKELAVSDEHACRGGTEDGGHQGTIEQCFVGIAKVVAENVDSERRVDKAN